MAIEFFDALFYRSRVLKYDIERYILDLQKWHTYLALALEVELKNISKAPYINLARYDSYNSLDCNVI